MLVTPWDRLSQVDPVALSMRLMTEVTWRVLWRYIGGEAGVLVEGSIMVEGVGVMDLEYRVMDLEYSSTAAGGAACSESTVGEPQCSMEWSLCCSCQPAGP